MGDNPYERQNRFLKAVRLVDNLESLSIPIDKAKQFSQKMRDNIAISCGFPPPSEDTWDIVVDLYTKRVTVPLA